MPANIAIAQNYEALDTIWVVLHLIFVNDKHFTGAILRVFPVSCTVQGAISYTKSLNAYNILFTKHGKK